MIKKKSFLSSSCPCKLELWVCLYNKHLFFFLFFPLSKVLFHTFILEFVDFPAHLSCWLLHLNNCSSVVKSLPAMQNMQVQSLDQEDPPRRKWQPTPVFLLQFSSVTQLCPVLYNSMDCSMPGFPVHHQLLELTQTYIHPIGDAIQPSLPLLSPSPPAPNPSQHQSLFQ